MLTNMYLSQRLFSFAQLLAFSLTFMESWEVMAM
jgi:hypothetical protein